MTNSSLKKRLYDVILPLLKELRSSKSDVVSRNIISQLVRSSTSIIANYVEAFAASSRREFTNYLRISLKSANETLFWLKLLKDLEVLTSEIYEKSYNEITEVSKILAKSIITLKSKSK